MLDSESRDREASKVDENSLAGSVQRLMDVYHQALGDDWRRIFEVTVRVALTETK
jgi:hypothetical protein